MNMASWLVPAGIVVVFIALVVLIMALQYRKVGPNEALIISGGRKRTVTDPDGTHKKVGYRYRLGGGTFVWPFTERVDVLPMDIITLTIRTPEVLTHGGVPLMAEATGQVKVDSSDAGIRKAAEQFLGQGKDGIRDVAMTVLEGKVREVIGTLTVEDIYRGRQEFSNRVSRRSSTTWPPWAWSSSLSPQGHQRHPGLPRRPEQTPDRRGQKGRRDRPGRDREGIDHQVVHGPQGSRGRPPPVGGPDRQGPV
jgi:regulator of protease activity HflC (stomatin/prohibitin superfamily)